MKTSILCLVGGLGSIPALVASPKANWRDGRADPYGEAIQRTSIMASDRSVAAMAGEHGLQVLNLTWEDTGRFKDSAVGPNISDMTIQVAHRPPRSRKIDVTCMPVIRYPNYFDKSCDIDPRDFVLLVGNEKGQPRKRVSLHRFLKHPLRYLTNPGSWKGADEETSLLAERDSKVLVSAQACFLPVPMNGKATFNPVLFNYQSMAGDPAVLTVLATREGTSATVIDNTRDAFETGSVWGQRLFHNQNGQRASLTGERLSDFKVREHQSPQPVGEVKRVPDAALNQVLLIQIPLKQKNPMRPNKNSLQPFSAVAEADPGGGIKRKSDVENAVIGHGDLEGPFTEIDGLAIERDPRYPVRVTVQFYKATATGKPSSQDISEIARQIERVYDHSDYVGSLVTAGETGRITEYDGIKVQPPAWWDAFWDRYEKEHDVSREEAIRRLRKLLGNDFRDQPVGDLFLRDQMR